MCSGEAAVVDKFPRESRRLCGYDLVRASAAVEHIFGVGFARGGIDTAALAGMFTHPHSAAAGSDYIRRPRNNDGEDFSLSEECAGLGRKLRAVYGGFVLQIRRSSSRFPPPNDILAVEYLKHLRRSDIKPLFIKRETRTARRNQGGCSSPATLKD